MFCPSLFFMNNGREKNMESKLIVFVVLFCTLGCAMVSSMNKLSYTFDMFK